MRKANGSIRAKRAVESVWSYALLVVIAFVFLFPCVWLITSSFRSTGSIYDYVGFFPESFSFSTWIDLFTKKTPSCNYAVWLSNTFYVAILSSVFSTILVILTAYTMSRFRFKSRKLMMKMTLLFGIFPTFMNMTALFVIMTQLHLFNNLNGLIILYSCSAPIGYLTQKGFFDTIPNSIYDAARIDGASNFQVFVKMTLPLSKAMIVYTALTSFTFPWSDFILPQMLLGGNKNNYTVAIGLNEMTDDMFSLFAAGSVFIAVPIVILYFSLAKFLVNGVAAGAVKE